jgi:uncharacterized protein (TIGR00661 family)
LAKKIKIFLCPLDWGIGHASRCVLIINKLRDAGHDITIGADGRSLAFLRTTFPTLPYIRFPGFMVSYPKKGSMTLRMLSSMPAIFRGIRQEHSTLDKILLENSFDVVISDNRFGLYNKRVTSVYMTHQVMVKMPAGLKWLEPLVYRYHKSIINRYDACWVPDLPGDENISGDLSHRYPLPAKACFIGPLSRFLDFSPLPDGHLEFRVVVLISGPEPQRTMMEEEWTGKLQNAPFPCAIFRGRPDQAGEPVKHDNLSVYNHADDRTIATAIKSAGTVIARSGYSTIMDLFALGRNAVLIPTPGQTEQAYLARHLSKMGYFAFFEQGKGTLEEVMAKSSTLKPLPDLFNLHLLRKSIKELVTDD